MKQAQSGHAYTGIGTLAGVAFFPSPASWTKAQEKPDIVTGST